MSTHDEYPRAELFNGMPVANLGPTPPKMGLKFANVQTGQEFLVEVHDRYPQMGEVHIEGRRYVEVSTEMFVALVAAQGFHPVEPEDKYGEFTEEEV